MKKRGVKLIVRGDLREILDSQCDFPSYINESIDKYNEFDFSHIKKSVEKYGEFFVVDFLENKKSCESLKAVSQVKSSIKERGQLYIDLIKKGYLIDDRVEMNKHVFTRVKKAKEFFKNFVKEKNLKDGELVIVTHSRFSKAWSSKDIDIEKDEFIDYYAPKNCEVFESDI